MIFYAVKKPIQKVDKTVMKEKLKAIVLFENETVPDYYTKKVQAFEAKKSAQTEETSEEQDEEESAEE